jgi:hypothetical protein
MPAATVTGRILTSPKILLNGYDMTGFHDKISAPISQEELTPQQFGAVGKQRMAGRDELTMTHSGFWEAGTGKPETVLHGLNLLGVGGDVLSLCPNTGAEGEQGWFTQVNRLKYESGGKVGGMTAFSGAAYSFGEPILDGTILKAATITASGTGSGVVLGAVSATQSIYAVLHVTATSGNANRTLDVIIESADAADLVFASPTTRMTFTQVTTAVSGEYLAPILGAVTDTRWRAKYTRGGTTGSFTMYVLFAIR